MSVRPDQRALIFTASDEWKGWHCDSCCWGVSLEAVKISWDEISAAGGIETLFRKHDCDRFARDGPA